MAGKPWSGRRVTEARRYTLQRDQFICWLCGHHGANSLDHVQPKSTRPDLMWDPLNWKAAHLTPAGTRHGCKTEGCTCTGNISRKATPPNQPRTRPW